jgi:hypothetical protein
MLSCTCPLETPRARGPCSYHDPMKTRAVYPTACGAAVRSSAAPVGKPGVEQWGSRVWGSRIRNRVWRSAAPRAPAWQNIALRHFLRSSQGAWLAGGPARAASGPDGHTRASNSVALVRYIPRAASGPDGLRPTGLGMRGVACAERTGVGSGGSFSTGHKIVRPDLCLVPWTSVGLIAHQLLYLVLYLV